MSDPAGFIRLEKHRNPVVSFIGRAEKTERRVMIDSHVDLLLFGQHDAPSDRDVMAIHARDICVDVRCVGHPDAGKRAAAAAR